MTEGFAVSRTSLYEMMDNGLKYSKLLVAHVIKTSRAENGRPENVIMTNFDMKHQNVIIMHHIFIF